MLFRSLDAARQRTGFRSSREGAARSADNSERHVLRAAVAAARRACNQAPHRFDIRDAGLRARRRTHELRARNRRTVPARCRLRRQDSQGSKTRRPADEATDRLPAHDQPKKRQKPSSARCRRNCCSARKNGSSNARFSGAAGKSPCAESRSAPARPCARRRRAARTRGPCGATSPRGSRALRARHPHVPPN